MRIVIHLVFGLFLLASVANADSAKLTILLTAFEPFGGRPVNNSAAIAKIVQRKLNHRFHADVHLCVLPVEYDRAAERAEQCFHSLPIAPNFVLSLGEAACAIRLETRAHNIDNTKAPDNAGITRTKKRVEKGPMEIGFHLKLPRMYCALDKREQKELIVSNDPGNYVCNNTAYHLENFFSKQSIPYGFIHVPNSSCVDPLRDPEKNANTIVTLVEAALPEIAFSEGSLPTTKKQVQEILSSTKQNNRANCEIEFFEKLLKNY